ncbi:MAG: hypothetical protein F6J94_06980 [Moorea sp. SIO1F2]|uniref:hypothetical protein n=1 Tax=Moorena sp. SIO1F2 TaxID=2607819 RepID=UPI0013BE376C|nr:hypothetical protein [Moorena sp. SIO1F2]NET81707.1 hypothetical protein [Moorena sp. SIO1F2]
MFSFPYSLLPTPYSLLPTPYSLFPVPFGIGIGIWMGKIVLASARVKYGAKQVLPLRKIPQP